ncbi:hypothetical protein BpHYR1_033633, partial [Brachionus plicatilis]
MNHKSEKKLMDLCQNLSPIKNGGDSMNEGFFDSPSTSQTPKRKACSEVEEIK